MTNIDKTLKCVLSNVLTDNGVLRRSPRSVCQRKPKKQTHKNKTRIESQDNPSTDKTKNAKNLINGEVRNAFTPKQLFIKLTPLEIHDYKKTLKKQPDTKKSRKLKCKIKTQKVTFKPGAKTEIKAHDLRALQPKHYLEESILDSSDGEENAPKNPEFNKNEALPVYRKILPDIQTVQSDDIYEFLESSPKTNKRQRRRNSSMLFDKETHKILKKLEEKEAKEKRKGLKKKKLASQTKTYDKIVGKIVSNVLQKIKNSNKSLDRETQNDQANNNRIIHLNNLQEEIDDTVNLMAQVPSSSINAAENIKTTTKEINKGAMAGIPFINKEKDPKAVTTRKPSAAVESVNYADIFHVDPILLQSIGSNDNSVSQRDIDSCFDFDTTEAPITSTPAKLQEKNHINIIDNVVLRRGATNIESPADFDVRRPNANSTMVHAKNPQKMSGSWRADFINVRHNPHFVSVKHNGLPRLNQDMVMDHILVESFERGCPKPPRNQPETPRRVPVQQSILDFVNSNIEKENEVLPPSLYDYDAFNSPKKKKVVTRAEGARRNLLCDVNNVVSSTPNKRRPLADIGNSFEESQNLAYFGFEESSRISPKKNYACEINDENNKPYRFDISNLRNYSKKANKQINFVDQKIAENPDESLSVMEASREENVGEICLFEGPEEMLDKMSPVHLVEKRPRRKRLNSCASDESDQETRRIRHHKKTKLEIQQAAWIKDFNKMCEEIDNHELELE